jgi:hypothetical protein
MGATAGWSKCASGRCTARCGPPDESGSRIVRAKDRRPHRERQRHSPPHQERQRHSPLHEERRRHPPKGAWHATSGESGLCGVGEPLVYKANGAAQARTSAGMVLDAVRFPQSVAYYNGLLAVLASWNGGFRSPASVAGKRPTAGSQACQRKSTLRPCSEPDPVGSFQSHLDRGTSA